jgi:hypothetical protein
MGGSKRWRMASSSIKAGHVSHLPAPAHAPIAHDRSVRLLRFTQTIDATNGRFYPGLEPIGALALMPWIGSRGRMSTMPNTSLLPNAGQIRLARQCALFIGILLSGGLLIFPRVPLAILLVFLCFVCKGPSFGLRREVAPILFLLVLVLIVAILGASGIDNQSLVIRYSNFALGLLMLGLYISEPRDQLAEDIRPILVFMSYQAIATAILGTLISSAFQVYDVSETFYHTILWVLTYHETIVDSGKIVRPDGFFYEPGVFQMYLNIFLFISLMITKKKSDIVLAIFGSISTQSTTGIIVVIGLILYYIIDNLRTASFWMRLLSIIVSPLIIAILSVVAYDNINEKVSGSSEGSSWARQYDFITGLSITLRHPVVGIGFDRDRYYEEARDYGYKETLLDDDAIANRGNSNGLATALYTVGIPLALVFFFGLFNQVFFQNKFMYYIVMIGSLFGEALFFTPFILMFVYSGLLRRSPPARVAQDAPALRA